MSEPIEEVKTAKPWQWPREWFRDEKFWREVTARAMSGLIVVTLAALAAWAGGYISQPPSKPLLFMVVSVYAFIFVQIANYYIERPPKDSTKPKILLSPEAKKRRRQRFIQIVKWLIGVVLAGWMGYYLGSRM